jgi:branched-chain amino acid transport system substrate-binding protein
MVHIVDYPFVLTQSPHLLTRAPPEVARGRLRFSTTLVVLVLSLGLGRRAASAGEADPPTEIVLGMSTVLTGVSADLGRDMQRGILAGFEHANRKGGLNGRKLRLISLDDGYMPARTAPNIRQLIEKDKVLAVIGNVGTPTAIVAVPLVNEGKTLLFAAFAGGSVLRNDPPDRYVINFRPGYAEEAGTMIDALVDVSGLKPEEIAFFAPRDSSSFSMGMSALRRHGLKDPSAILHLVYERETLAVEGAVADLLTAEKPPRAVMLYGAYAACAKFVRLCRTADLNPIFVSGSFTGSTGFAEALGNTDAHVIGTQVVPDPSDDTLPITGEFRADLKALDPLASAGFGDLEGYIAARIFTLALEKIKEQPTRESIVDALERLGQFDIGLGEPLYLSQMEHQASHRIWLTHLEQGRFAPFHWSDIKNLLKTDSPP